MKWKKLFENIIKKNFQAIIVYILSGDHIENLDCRNQLEQVQSKNEWNTSPKFNPTLIILEMLNIPSWIF